MVFMYHTCNKVHPRHTAQSALQNEHTCSAATQLSTHSTSCIPEAAPVPPVVLTLPRRTALLFLSTVVLPVLKEIGLKMCLLCTFSVYFVEYRYLCVFGVGILLVQMMSLCVSSA